MGQNLPGGDDPWLDGMPEETEKACLARYNFYVGKTMSNGL